MIDGTISLVLIVPLFILFLKQICCSNDNTMKIPILYKYSSFFTFLLTIILNIANIMIYIAVLYGYGNLYSYSIHTFDITFLLAMLSSYVLLLSRQHFTFNLSIYQHSNWVMYSHLINILLILISYVFGYLVSYLTLQFVAEFLCIIGQIHLLYKFNNNLFSLILLQRNGSLTQWMQTFDRNDTEINLPTIRKHTVLAVFMIVSLLVTLCVWISWDIQLWTHLMNLRKEPLTTSQFLNYRIIGYSCFIFELDIIIICIYLSYNLNSGFYRIMCCICDKQCNNIWVKLAERKLK